MKKNPLIPETWCKNAIGFIIHRNRLHESLQPIALAIAASFMKQWFREGAE